MGSALAILPRDDVTDLKLTFGSTVRSTRSPSLLTSAITRSALVMGDACWAGPFNSVYLPRAIFECIATSVGTEICDNDAGLVTVLAGRDCRIDRDNNTPHRRQVIRAYAGRPVIAQLPQGSDDVVENIGVQFLEAESGAFISAQDVGGLRRVHSTETLSQGATSHVSGPTDAIGRSFHGEFDVNHSEL
jgi:hypothetical protein